MEDFVTVAQLNDIGPGEMKLVDVENEEIVLANLGGNLVAFSNACPHAACDMIEGNLDTATGEIECDCHGSRFNALTGQVLSPPALTPLVIYEVKIDGDSVLLGPQKTT
jgi:3-phenylpropionate/trans-cinnamate dioxygenase ferredoxin subunit